MKLQVFVFLILTSFIVLSLNNIASLLKPLTNDHYNYIAINEIKMWVSNNGNGSHDPNTDNNGLYWPGGIEAVKAAVFEDGLLWGGTINDSIHVNGNTHRQGLQAGKILAEGNPDNPDLPKYRVYRIRKDWASLPPGDERDAYEKDYNEWPVEDGAPWIDTDGDSIYTFGVDEPKFSGDEMLWFVSNDMDTSRSRRTYGSDPIGLEIQTLVYGYNEDNFLSDVIFKKYTLINKGSSTINSMYISYWTDVDLGDANDDFVGCDTLLDLGFTYNGDNEDGDGTGRFYGTPPPAAGHMFVQGPIAEGELSDSARFKGKLLPGFKNLPMTSFILHISANSEYTDPSQGIYEGTIQYYRNMRSMIWNGNPIIDPNTGLAVKFALSGDPVAGEGWYEGPGWPGGENPSDRRFLMTSGPITMAVGDTQEVEIAIFMAIGENNIDSITRLKETTWQIHQFFGNDIASTVENTMSQNPNTYSLHQNYPN
ncbi:MAG: hypothetical protein ACW99Q_24935, partial [Candidatus Kariarchaeaceae archaeon]